MPKAQNLNSQGRGARLRDKIGKVHFRWPFVKLRRLQMRAGRAHVGVGGLRTENNSETVII